MAVQEARQGAEPGTYGGVVHAGGCTCGDCPHGAREGHRRAVAAFLLRRDEFAAGQGLPAAVAHSPSATRQWVSDELTQSAQLVAERSRAEGGAWLARLWRRTAITAWALVLALLLVQALTAIGAGWTAARTAGLLAALVVAAALTAASFFHRARGGALAPVIGEDNRLSTSRAVAAAWVLFLAYAVLVLAGQLAAASDHDERDELIAGLELARRPDQLPDLPWGLAAVVLISAATYLAGKYSEGGRPVILSVVRAREAGDLDAPIRTGEDIEIRGAGFVPPGAQGADRLSRMAVRIGAVHVHVPLVPVTGGFSNPTDTLLTVPVPVDVEPGRVTVQVVTAAGVETNPYVIEVTE
ncbi:MAG TPA: hypothetical protein VK545_00450 [Streptomyces sp.]|nr:hypothetical protein [Streptomyces sp.]